MGKDYTKVYTKSNKGLQQGQLFGQCKSVQKDLPQAELLGEGCILFYH